MPTENEEPTSKLNEFLKDWDEKKSDDGNKELLAKIAEQGEQIKGLLDKDVTRDKEAAYKEDIKPVIATVKGEETASDKTVNNWLNGEADEDPKLSAIFENRDENPEAFDKMIKELTPRFKEYIQAEAKNVLDIKDDDPPEKTPADPPADPKNDKDDTAERALAHAVRIMRNENAVASDDYDKVEWSSLSDSEFARMSQKVFKDMENGKLKPVKAA